MWYNKVMERIVSYDIGTHVDLSYLNRVIPTVEKKSNFQETSEHLYEVGAQIWFDFTQQNVKSWRRIPVVFQT